VNNVLDQLVSFLKEAEQTFTYEKIFDLAGVTDILEEMYITPKDLNKDYIKILYNAIVKFIKQPLYKDTSLSDEKDLKFLKTDDQFIAMIHDTISKIKKELDSRSVRVMNELKNYKPKEEISLEDFGKTVRLDKSSLLFILDGLKSEGVIYDYNGREITNK